MGLNKKVTLHEVIGRDYKKEVTALASEMAGGAKSGSQQAFGNYKKALKTFIDNLSEEAMAQAEVERQRWEAEGKPDDIKVRFVTWNVCLFFHLLSDILLAILKNTERTIFAQQQKCNSGNLAHGSCFGNSTRTRLEFNSMTGRSGSASADESVIIIWDTSHGYNPDIGDLNLLSFAEMFPEEFKIFEKAFVQYMKYVGEVQAGNVTEEARHRPVKSLLELRTDDQGFPLLPPAASDPTKDTLDYQKHLMRSFLTAHYSKIHFLSEQDIF